VERAQTAVAEIESAIAESHFDAPDCDAARLRAAVAHAAAVLAEFTVAPGEAPRAAKPRESSRQDGGFSLIELLIVTSLTMTLAALAMPAYEGALNRARITRAIGDINALGKEITMFQVGANCFPASLADIQRASLKDPWGRNYTYQVARAPGGRGGGAGSCMACANSCVPPGSARKDKNLVPINADFDLFSAGKDGQSSGPLTAKNSQDDIIRGRSGSFIGLAADY
jgi:general secretion pathway protein G